MLTPAGWPTAQPEVEVIVVSGEFPHDSGWPRQPQGGADEDELGACGDEPVHERLSKTPVDVVGAARRQLAAIAPWQVDVDVEPVLM